MNTILSFFGWHRMPKTHSEKIDLCKKSPEIQNLIQDFRTHPNQSEYFLKICNGLPASPLLKSCLDEIGFEIIKPEVSSEFKSQNGWIRVVPKAFTAADELWLPP